MKLILWCTFLFGIVSSFLANTSQSLATVGSEAPDFDLEAIGKRVKLSNYFGEGKFTVVVFSRASWCPFCLRQLIEFRRNVEQFEQADAEIIFVFREESKGIDGLKAFQARSKTNFTMALDNESIKTGAYSPGDGEFSTYIIDESGTVQKILKGDIRNRVKSRKILDAIDSLSAVPA